MRKNNLSSGVPLHPPTWTCLLLQALGRSRLTLNNRTVLGKNVWNSAMEKFTQLPLDTFIHGAPTLFRHSVIPTGCLDNILLQVNTTLIFANKEGFFHRPLLHSQKWQIIQHGSFQERRKCLLTSGLQPKFRVNSLSKSDKKVKDFSAIK